MESPLADIDTLGEIGLLTGQRCYNAMINMYAAIAQHGHLEGSRLIKVTGLPYRV